MKEGPGISSLSHEKQCRIRRVSQQISGEKYRSRVGEKDQRLVPGPERKGSNCISRREEQEEEGPSKKDPVQPAGQVCNA